MAIPSKGSRRIEADGDAYRWRIRQKPTYLQGAFQASMTVAIQSCAEDATSVLVVDLRVSRPDNWIAPHQTALTPALVRDIVRAALAAGWQPRGGRSPFTFEYALVRDPP